MQSKFKHMAIISYDPKHLGEFYRNAFGMTGPDNPESSSSVISDGYVGMNINRHSNGRKVGLNHFGMEIDDLEELRARLRERYPEVEVLERPSNRPFAGLSTHDPEGNIFDLSHRAMANRKGIYVEDNTHAERFISHFMVPAIDAPALATFYRDMYDLRELPREENDSNYYLSDGTVTLVVRQWRLSDYGMGGLDGKPTIDHIGFHVESMERFLNDVDKLAETDPSFAPRPFRGVEGAQRKSVFGAASIGEYQLADPDGVLLDITER